MQFANPKHTVFIADDHEIVRLGLQHCLASEAGFEVVGEASNGIEAYSKIVSLEPEIVILDIVMPEMDGLALANTLSILEKPPKTILVTADENFIDIDLIFGLQVNGVLLKGISSTDLLFALTKVLDGYYVYSKAFFLSLLYNGNKKEISAEEKGIVYLTNLQKAIIVDRLKGRSINKIAHDMNLSLLEVENYINSLDAFFY